MAVVHNVIGMFLYLFPLLLVCFLFVIVGHVVVIITVLLLLLFVIVLDIIVSIMSHFCPSLCLHAFDMPLTCLLLTCVCSFP